MPDAAKKTCKMCFMEIPAEAKKCPYCQHFQNRLSTFLFHPAFAGVFVMIVALSPIIFFARMLRRGEEFERYSDQIQITESRIAFGETKSGNTIAVIGTIKNNSAIPWKYVHFQVDFQDANGQRVDSGQSEEYSYVLPAGESQSFKISFRREFPETNYVHHTVRAVWAKDARTEW
jgi:hypothetical protein